MDTTKYEAIAQMCANKSEYFSKLGFTNLVTSFDEAAKAINELAELLNKAAEKPAEEGNNE
jgi:hypothetical protein